MAALKWKRKGLKVKRRVFTRRDMKAWVKGEGKDALQEAKKELWLRWFFGKRRARRVLFKRLVRPARKDKAFRLALQERLNQLPSLISSVAVNIQQKGPSQLVQRDGAMVVVAIPRALIQNDYSRKVESQMFEAEHFKRHAQLPGFFIRKKALDAEDLFFRILKGESYHICSEENGIILGVDTDFDWHLKNIPGHYYYGYTDSPEMNLKTWRGRRRFRKGIQKPLRREKQVLGNLNVHDIIQMTEDFWAK